MRIRDFSPNTHQIRPLKEMDVSTLLKRAHSVSTFDGKYYVVLDNNSRLYDQKRRREILLGTIFKYIKHVRDSDGHIIAKKSKICDKLMQVKYVKRCKKAN